MYELNVFITKNISILVFIKCINDLITCLYTMASTIYELVSYNNIKFDAIGVVMALQSNILNLFNISTTDFTWLWKISCGLFQTSKTNNHAKILELWDLLPLSEGRHLISL